MFNLFRKKKRSVVSEKRLSELVRNELHGYIKKEELGKELENIENDKRKKKLWDSLPGQKKLRILRYVAGKRGESHGKK